MGQVGHFYVAPNLAQIIALTWPRWYRPKIVCVCFFCLRNVLKYLFLQWVFEHQPKFAPKWAKNHNFSPFAEQRLLKKETFFATPNYWCFMCCLFESIDVDQKTQLKKRKSKDKKDLKDKARQEKKQKGCLMMFIAWNKNKKTWQRNKETKTKQQTKRKNKYIKEGKRK